MTYPQVPQPQFTQPQYVQPQVQYAQPVQYQQPQPAYAPQYAQPQPLQGTPAPPAPVLARGTLEDFDDQVVGGGGPSVTKFHAGRPDGSWVHVRVARDLTNNDVRQQTEFKTNVPKTYKDGKPKFDLWVPLQVIAASDPAGAQQLFPEGTAVAYLKPDRGDGLKSTVSRALAAIGNPDGLRTGVLGGIELVISSAGLKPNGTPNPTKLWQVQAFPPQGQAAPAPVQVTQAAPAPMPAAPSAPVAAPQPIPSATVPAPGVAPAMQAAPATAASVPVPPTPAPAGAAIPMTAVAPGPVVPSAQFQAPPAPATSQAVTVNGETKEQLLARLNASR